MKVDMTVFSKDLLMLVLLMREVIANPCARLGCSCADPKHLYCSGTSTISARALAEAVVAGEVESADFRYRLFSGRFLGQLDVYFDNLQTVRVEGGPCQYIVGYIGNTRYNLLHNCVLPDPVITAETASVSQTTELSTTMLSTAEKFDVTEVTTSALALVSYDKTTSAASSDTEMTTRGRHIELSTSVKARDTEMSRLVDLTTTELPREITSTDKALEVYTGPDNVSDSALAVIDRKSGEIHVSVSSDGTVDVILPYTLSLLAVFLIVVALIIFCIWRFCCRPQNLDSAVCDPDPENPGEVALVSANPAKDTAALLGEGTTSEDNDVPAGEAYMLTTFSQDEQSDSAAYVETTDIGLQVSIPPPSPAPSDTAGDDWQADSTLVEDDQENLTGESFLDMHCPDDSHTLCKYPASASLTLSSGNYTTDSVEADEAVDVGLQVSITPPPPTRSDTAERAAGDPDNLSGESFLPDDSHTSCKYPASSSPKSSVGNYAPSVAVNISLISGDLGMQSAVAAQSLAGEDDSRLTDDLDFGMSASAPDISDPVLTEDDSRLTADLDSNMSASAPDVSPEPAPEARRVKKGRPKKGERSGTPQSWGLKKTYQTRGSKMNEPLESGLPSNIRI